MAVDAERLRAIPLFADLGREELDWLAERVSERVVSEGVSVTHEGVSGYAFFMIEDGEARVVHGDREVRRLAPGDTFGEAAIIGDGHRTADVIAATDLELLALFGTHFRELQMEMPQLADRIQSTMELRKG
jgi:CRP/FNR family transcriptional regulator, cyclic AMP receptor protein